MTALTEDQFKGALPPSVRRNVTSEMVDKMNDLLADPDMCETYRDNLVSYGHVMKEGRFKVSSYIDAVKYVSQKMMDKTNLSAFTATFPDKVADWQARGISAKDISSYVSAYSKSKLVNLIFEQSLIHTSILNQDMFQKALNVQAELMQGANSEKVRSDAANSILTHLKRAETQRVELAVDVKEDSALAGLREITAQYVAAQRQAIQAGSMDAQQAAHERLVIDNGSGEVDE